MPELKAQKPPKTSVGPSSKNHNSNSKAAYSGGFSHDDQDEYSTDIA